MRNTKQENKTKSNTTTTVFAVMMIASMFLVVAFADIAQGEECDACSARPPPEETHNTSSAPGYCTSHGGSHSYEYISSITYTLNPGGTMTITVDIYIANPTGCTYGKPCPEYDNSPEYVNVWVDWDGDKVFESGEKVIDVALTGYSNLNYYGTMTTSKIVTIPPDAENFTWMRTNLGWGHDPNDPCAYAWAWGDIVDKEVMVRPEIEIKGGLKQYKEDKLKDKVFRRKDDKPRFEVKALPQDGEKVEVDIFRKGNTPIKTIEAVKKSGKMYNATWADWKSSEWSDSEIPDKIPIGEYKIKAKITKSGTEVTSSDKKEFYVIFNTPSGLGDAERKAFLYDDHGRRDEIGVWFFPFEVRGTDGKLDGGDWGMRYLLHPFSSEVFVDSDPGKSHNIKGAIKVVDGETSPLNAITKLSQHVNVSFTYNTTWRGVNSAGQHDIKTLLTKPVIKPKAECSDMASLLVSYSRSIGVPSHTTTVDANPRALEVLDPINESWGYHTWTEVYIDDLYVTDPHDNLHGFTPINRLTFGTQDKFDIYHKIGNDIIIMGSPSFENSKLGTASNFQTYEYDIFWDFNPDDLQNYSSGLSVPKQPLLIQENWVEDISFDYWGINYHDQRNFSDPPLNLQLSMNKASYRVSELVIINVTITNPENTSFNSTLQVTAIDIVTPGAIPEKVSLYSSNETVYMLANSNMSIIKSFTLPQNLDTSDQFYVEANYGNETNWRFFDVTPLFNTSILLPAAMIEGEEYTFNVSINNTGSEILTGVNVTLLVSSDMVELLDGASYYVGDLTAGEEANISWNVKVVGPSLGGITFKVESENGGIDYISDYVEVLTQPELDIGDEYVPFFGEFGEPFGIGFRVKNIGDLNATNVYVEISLPENVTATNTTWNIANLPGGEEVTLYTDITFDLTKDFLIDVFASDDAGHNSSGVVWVHIITALAAEFNDVYADYGVDTGSDGLYNYLTVEAGVNVTTAGTCSIEGWLYDGNGNEIAQADNSTYLNTGNQSVTLNFDGFTIYKHGVDGPYNLSYLKLYDANGTLIDSRDYAYTTSTYNYADFQHLVALTGNYSDYGTDTDSNGLFNNLTVDVEVIPANAGNVVVSARLMDSGGEEIIWATNTTWLDTGLPQNIQLNFDGRYIYGNMVDGPYYLRDVYVYHTGDPTLPDYVYDAHTTAAYSYTEFEGSGVITGTVTDAGTPVQNAFISISGGDSDYTNAAGEYSLVVLQDGTHTVNIEATGYELWKIFVNSEYVTDDNSVDVSALIGEVTYVDFTQEIGDTESPTIESVTLDAYTTIPDATIHITVEATDNIGVTSVAADGAPLVETGSIWEGDITAPSTTGGYTLTITAEDAAGNTAETTVDYSVVIPTGGLGVAILPKISSAATGSTLPLDIKIVSTENFDDILHVYLTLDGIPLSYQADLDWFDWTDTTIQAPAGGEIMLPIEVAIPGGTSPGYKSFGVKVESTKWSSDAQDYGAIMIT